MAMPGGGPGGGGAWGGPGGDAREGNGRGNALTVRDLLALDASGSSVVPDARSL